MIKNDCEIFQKRFIGENTHVIINPCFEIIKKFDGQLIKNSFRKFDLDFRLKKRLLSNMYVKNMDNINILIKSFRGVFRINIP